MATRFRILPKTLFLRILMAGSVLLITYTLALIPLLKQGLDYDYTQTQQHLYSSIGAELATRFENTLAGGASFTDLERIAAEFSVANPKLQIHLLNSSGEVVHTFFGLNNQVLQRVDMAPVERFMRNEPFPIFGDDPRHHRRKALIIAAPITHQQRQYFVYVTYPAGVIDSLNSLRLDSLTYSGLGTTLAGLIIGGLALGALLSYQLTRRIGLLGQAVSRYAAGVFTERASLSGEDEIAQLGKNFDSMADTLAKAMNQLAERDQRRRELVAGVSHDLSGPAGVLLNTSDLLLQAESLPQEQQRGYLESISRNSQYLRILLGDLVDLSKLESVQTIVALDAIELELVFRDVVISYRPLAQRLGVNLEYVVPDDSPYIRADGIILERVLGNLLGNALRYTGSGGVVTLSAQRADSGKIVVSVTDNGTGIPKEEFEKVFLEFYQPEGAVKGLSGLGLTICRRLLESLGSDIQVDSTVGKGSTFSFALAEVAE
jgi:signal transduction histidine kinase